jgi:hypothetical protein
MKPFRGFLGKGRPACLRFQVFRLKAERADVLGKAEFGNAV